MKTQFRTPTTKTMLFWLQKRCRKAKMVGLASAPGSVHKIKDYRRLAATKEGKFFIVSGENASEGRELINQYRSDPNSLVPIVIMDDGNTIGIGNEARRAFRGATIGEKLWDERLQAQGIVYERQTIALQPLERDNA